ncbi:MAG: hypothetical protein JWM80_5261 [Cyanobacteria bacterium RYN_339]|nr:hypothetical protein [Cyanobacteria bacterium RYN_339]
MPDTDYAPDPITLVCLLAAFACGIGAWGDMLLPGILAHHGHFARAVVVCTEARALPKGGHEDFITYRYGTNERRERVSSLTTFGMPAAGTTLGVRFLPELPAVARLQGNEGTTIAPWLLGAAVALGLAGLGNFRQWRYSGRG